MSSDKPTALERPTPALHTPTLRSEARAPDPATDVIAIADQLARTSTAIEVQLERAQALENLGRRDEALATLTRLAHHPYGYLQPVAVALAWARLGELAAAAHDDPHAREAFTEVIRRWDRAEARPEPAHAHAYLDTTVQPPR